MLGVKALQRYSLFGGLLEDQLDKIIPLLTEETFHPDQTIFVEGVPNDRILFIIKGRVSVIKGSTVIYDLTEGSTFGEMEVLDVMPCAATIKAVTKVTALTISNASLREIYKNDIKAFALLLMNLARDLSHRLRVANRIMVDGQMYDLYSSALSIQD